MIYSFDIYDTVLTRPLLDPADIFYLSALRLSPAKNGDFSPLAYKHARRRAESSARVASRPKDDCQFSDIYFHFRELAEWGIPIKTAMQAELDTEREATRIVRANAETVLNLIESGEKVIFISDMYLPGDFLWELLIKNGIRCSREDVFVSSDYGLGKYSGRLYDYVLRKFGIPPSYLCHVGDNHHSDVRVPLKIGIQARHFSASQSNRYERYCSSTTQTPHIVSISNGVARSARLMITSAENSCIARIACNVVAPFLTAFVFWVLRDARSKGFKRLYFVSRDGQIFHKIAECIRQPDDPECRYLYGSRQAWFLPALRDATPEDFEWAWAKGMSRTGKDILRRLEVDIPEVQALLKHCGFGDERLRRKMSDEDFTSFKSLLLTEEIAEYVLAQAQDKRSVVQDYFVQEGLLGDERWALVDVGWTLKTQKALRRLLQNCGTEKNIHGYYLGIVDNHEPLHEAGTCSPFVTTERSDLKSPLMASWLFKLSTIILIEHCFTLADHASVCTYRRAENKVIPVFNQATENKEVIVFTGVMHDAILRYASEISRSSLDFDDDAVRKNILSNVFDFCMRPTTDDVDCIAWLPANKDQTHHPEHVSRISDSIGINELWQMICDTIASNHEAYFSPRFAWIEGSLAISRPHVRWLYLFFRHLNGLRSMILNWLGLLQTH